MTHFANCLIALGLILCLPMLAFIITIAYHWSLP